MKRWIFVLFFIQVLATALFGQTTTTYYITRNGITTNAEPREPGERVRFTIVYKERITVDGTGFDDPELGQQRVNALNAAFQYYATILNDTGEALIFVVKPENCPGWPVGGNQLAAASTPVRAAGGFVPGFVARHLITGIDPDNSAPDGYISYAFSSATQYNYDPDRSPATYQYDFYTSALHEIMHLLGFFSYSDAAGNSRDPQHPNTFTVFDKYLLDGSYTPVFKESGAGDGLTITVQNPSALTGNTLFFNNLNGNKVPMYSPAAYSDKSFTHIDNGRSTSGKYMMNAFISKGQSFRALHPDEVYALVTLGYNVDISLATAVDENEDFGPVERVYPNPVSTGEGVHINIHNLNEKEVLVVVYDMLGRLSYSKVIVNPGSGVLTALDPHNNLSPGMYIIIGSAGHELFNQKLVIE